MPLAVHRTLIAVRSRPPTAAAVRERLGRSLPSFTKCRGRRQHSCSAAQQAIRHLVEPPVKCCIKEGCFEGFETPDFFRAPHQLTAGVFNDGKTAHTSAPTCRLAKSRALSSYEQRAPIRRRDKAPSAGHFVHWRAVASDRRLRASGTQPALRPPPVVGSQEHARRSHGPCLE